MKSLKIGHGKDSDTRIRFLGSPKQLRRVLGYLEGDRREGAQAVLEGGLARMPGREGGRLQGRLQGTLSS